MKYDGIIFDLDGVICHTDEYHYFAWKTIADKSGIPFNKSMNNRLRGVSRMESLEIILENSDKQKWMPAEKATLAKEKNEIYRELLKKMSPKDLSEQVSKSLLVLRAMGLKLAIGSSSKNAKLILQQIGLDSFFDAVIDGNDIIDSKPDPEVFVRAKESLGISSKRCLVVEDAEAGIKAAVFGRMDTAAIGNAINCGLETYQLSCFADLIDIVKGEESCQ